MVAVGLALAVYPIGVERDLMSRATVIARTLTTLRFFASCERSTAPDATGYKGFY